MSAHYAVRDGVALIALDNPPVNALALAARQGMVASIEAAAADAAVVALVIHGAGRVFSAGADIGELGTALALEEPTLWSVLAAVESSAKPVIAALHGGAFGGGLELALAAHYRIAAAGTRVGLPEVKIGIVPGAGGTQRLPRAVGLDRAIKMIVSGDPLDCEQLTDTRLFDAVTGEDLLEFACRFARAAAARGGPHPRVRDWSVAHANAAALFERARIDVGEEGRYPAKRRCLQLLQAAIDQPFEAGLALEIEALSELVRTDCARSLRHIFLAERAAKRIEGASPDGRSRKIERLAVVGAGTMGSGIAVSFLGAGIPVVLIDSSEAALRRGLHAIHSRFESGVRKGRMTEETMQRCLKALSISSELAEAGSADLVIEAVFEEYAAKEEVFRRLDALMKPGAVLASNTSTLDIDRIAALTSRPQDVLGMHFFSPADVMKLLELVRGKRTAPEVLSAAMEVASRIGKIAVVAGVCDGFIGNRMLEEYLRQAGFLLDLGCLPWQIDRAIEQFGFAMGPFRMIDLAGNDISWAIRQRRRREHPEQRYSSSADLLCERGRFGQKCAAGWYDYRPGDRTAHPSPEVQALLGAHTARLGVPARALSDQEIVERLVFALINEGANLLADGIAARASDIDLVYLYGYGFPRWRGGPMFHADRIGLRRVLQSIEDFSRGYVGESWAAAPLLRRLAETGGTFTA